jgi:hypothetical protein
MPSLTEFCEFPTVKDEPALTEQDDSSVAPSETQPVNPSVATVANPVSSAVQSNAAPVGTSFFYRNIEARSEIIEGILREGELAAFGGPFGMGKSPLLYDLTVCLIYGLSWCGCKVERRPVIAIDCETPGADYKNAITAISCRYGVPVPRVRADLFVYLERDDPSEPDTKHLLQVVSETKHGPKLDLIHDLLELRPNAVVIIDPLEMFFRLDTAKKADVMSLYRPLRSLMGEFPHAAVLNTFNLRKIDRKGGRADLLSDPRGWLEEVCGSLDLLNRSDVRLGIDMRGEDVRVINGIVRGREMNPMLIRTFVDAQERQAGFERVLSSQQDLLCALAERQREYWKKLPSEFKFEDAADKLVPRSSLHRLIKRVCSLGVLRKADDGVFRKV